MTSSEQQNGIDILCDAAGSDMLLSSLFSLASPDQRSQHPHGQQQPPHDLFQSYQAHVQSPRSHTSSAPSAPPVPAKRKLSDASPSSPSHVCHICKRVYERADHLTRHLRSHENARPYQCSRCPKRFNRADLLTRHETTHDRDGTAKGRPFIRRSDRAAEACLNCAASKAKCEDQKPCSRCRNKSLTCQMPPRRGQQYRTSDGATTVTGGISDSNGSVSKDATPGGLKTPQINDHAVNIPASYEGPSLLGNNGPAPPPAMENVPEDFMYFNPITTSFQDVDISWDHELNGLSIPQVEASSASLPSAEPANPKASTASQHNGVFKRSAWIFEPAPKESNQQETDAWALIEEIIPTFLSSNNPANTVIDRLTVSPIMRDHLLTIAVRHGSRLFSFPPLQFFDHCLQAHFAQDEHDYDGLVHASSFDSNRAIPELLCALVSSGATHISAPAVWRFGLALGEAANLAIDQRIKNSLNTSPDLMMLQTLMLHIDIGQWSGLNSQMTNSESSIPALLTMLRRHGKLSFSSDQIAQIPSMSDAADVLDSKWKHFIILESYKRLALRLFFHDVQSSIGLCKNPLMSFHELRFSLPASRDLWKAKTAGEWRDAFLAKNPIPIDSNFPQVSETMQTLASLTDLEGNIDIDLCYMAVLQGFWGQISSYHDAVKFYGADKLPIGGSAPPLWLKSQQQEVYRTISEFMSRARRSDRANARLALMADLFMMLLHVSSDDLQRFAGKFGDDEAQGAADALETIWMTTSDSRYAAWHAGQVFRHAQKMPPTSLWGFDAMAVYLASLTLWAYGTASESLKNQDKPDGQGIYSLPTENVPLDGEETRASRTFLQLHRGTPGLTSNGAGFEPLTNSASVLAIAQNLFRDNYPVRHEPLPPFVESLCQLLRDLKPSLPGRASEPSSENAV